MRSSSEVASTLVTREVASQVAAQVASQVAAQVATQVALATQVATQVAGQQLPRVEATQGVESSRCFFMRGGLGHAGAGYDADNVRVHAYIECEPRRARRKKRARSETQQVRQTYVF